MFLGLSWTVWASIGVVGVVLAFLILAYLKRPSAGERAVKEFEKGNRYWIFTTPETVQFAAEYFRKQIAEGRGFSFKETIVLLQFWHYAQSIRVDSLRWQDLRGVVAHRTEFGTASQILRLREAIIGIGFYGGWAKDNWNHFVSHLNSTLQGDTSLNDPQESKDTKEGEEEEIERRADVIRHLEKHVAAIREYPDVFDQLVQLACKHVAYDLLLALFGSRQNIPEAVAEQALRCLSKRQDEDMLYEKMNLLAAVKRFSEIQQLAENTSDKYVRQRCEDFLTSNNYQPQEASSPATVTEHAQ